MCFQFGIRDPLFPIFLTPFTEGDAAFILNFAHRLQTNFSHLKSFILILERCVYINNACFFFMEWPSKSFPAWLRIKPGGYLFLFERFNFILNRISFHFLLNPTNQHCNWRCFLYWMFTYNFNDMFKIIWLFYKIAYVLIK